MTVVEALNAIRRVGTVEERAGNLRLRVPEAAASELNLAIETLRGGKAEALALLLGPAPAEIAGATNILNRLGVRQMEIDGVTTVGVWSDLDGPELRTALRIHGKEGLPLRYLDGENIPPRYKSRYADGEPVPSDVLAAMERHPVAPWAVRDQMFGEARKRRPVTPWGDIGRKGAARLTRPVD